MAADERQEEERREHSTRHSRSRNGREVFLGDLERRRPTKRQTTVRSFGVVRNWAKQNISLLKTSSQSTHVLPRIETSPSNVSSSEQLRDKSPSIQDAHSILRNDDDVDVSHHKSPVPPSHSNLQSSLPGAAVGTPVKLFEKNSTEPRPSQEFYEDNDDMVAIQHTPEHNVVTPQIGLKSGPQSKETRSVGRKKVVAFEIDGKKGNGVEVDDEDYEAHNFVRLFNADRGRKRRATDITDLDIILTNIEEIALEIKSGQDSPLGKRVMREAFIQVRQIFSDSIDVYKEKKYLQSATTKTNTKIKKMKQELINVQSKRRRTQTKLENLQSEYEELEKQRKGKEEAYSFLSEFESLQKRLRKSNPDHTQKEPSGDEPLTSLLCEASGYLSTQRHLKNINDKLQLWLDKNKP